MSISRLRRCGGGLLVMYSDVFFRDAPTDFGGRTQAGVQLYPRPVAHPLVLEVRMSGPVVSHMCLPWYRYRAVMPPYCCYAAAC